MGSRVFKSNVIDRQIFLILSFLTLLFCAQIAAAQEKFPTGELSVRTSENIHNFDIELALDDSHRQYGMMFRTSNPETNGMLFVYDNKKRISMWMKNTFISLDILFIDEVGKIIRIEQSAQPRSLSLIRSGGEAKAVLELNGGLTKKLNIVVGDEIIHSTFGNITK
ncbi:MAG: DUF192 domain-containing protein [Emcibacteraceae bacterium]|nr:DUF192 domain-containing protein [Emcibacteraceae bacterium]MDG1859769.1 DUF192 domain-containing protein [Emcibacteraceae bacterium]